MSDLFENFWKITKLDCKTIQVIQNRYVSIQIICECKNLHSTMMDCSCIQNGESQNYIYVNKQLILRIQCLILLHPWKKVKYLQNLYNIYLEARM